MRYLYIFFFVLLAVMTAYNKIGLDSAICKIEEYEKVCKSLNNDSQNYLSSLTGNSTEYYGSIFLLMTGDTIKFTDINKPCLFYSFSPNDCMTCVEENIFALIEMAKDSNSRGIYILTTKERMRYLKILSRTHKVNSLYFGCLLDTTSIVRSNYYLKLGNGNISNTFYPVKGQFGSTQRYLKTIRSIISIQNQNTGDKHISKF